MTALNNTSKLGGVTAAVILSVAVANSPAVAHADADGEHSSPTPPSASQTDSSTTSPAGQAEDETSSVPKATSTDIVSEESDSAIETEEPDTALEVGGDGTEAADDDIDTGDTGDTEADEVEAEDNTTKFDAVTGSDTTPMSSGSQATPRRQLDATPSPSALFSVRIDEDEPLALDEATTSISDIPISAVGGEFSSTASDFTTLSQTSPTEEIQALASPTAATGAATGAVTRVLTSVLAWIGLPPGAASSPIAPATDIGLWAALAWVRRQFESTFINQSPTVAYNPVQTSQTVDGVITGTLQATDPEGDPLTYTVTRQPDNGTVAINPDGTFTYTPKDGFVGLDGFTVRVTDDTGSVVHGLLRAINAGLHGDSATVNLHAVTVETIDVGGSPFGMAIDRDRTYVAGGGNDEVVVIDNSTNEVIARIDIGENTTPRDVALTPDGKYLYVANFDVTHVSVIDTETNAIIATIDVGNGANAIGVGNGGERVYVATGTEEGHVVVINTEVNEPVTAIPVGELPSAIAANNHGPVYVTNRDSQTISMIDPVTNWVERTVEPGFTPIGAALSPDGQTLYVVGDNDNTLHIFNANTLAPIAELLVGEGPFGVGLQTSDNSVGRGLVANAFSDSVTLLQLDSPLGVLGQIQTGGQQPVAVAVNPDGTTAYVTNFDSGTVSVINLGESAAPSTPSPQFGPFGLLSFVADQIYHTLFNRAPEVTHPTEQHVQNADGTISGAFGVLDPDGDDVMFTVTQQPENGTVEINPDGTYTYTPDPGHSGPDTFTVRVTDNTPSLAHALLRTVSPTFHSTSATAQVITAQVSTIQIGGEPSSVVVTPDGKHVYVTNGSAGVDVAVIDTQTNAVIDHVNVGSISGGAVVSPDGTKIYVAQIFGENVAVIDTQTNAVTTIDIGANTFDVAISPDGSRVYASRLSNGELAVIDTSTNTVIDTVTVGNTPTGVAISPDGKQVYVANTFSGTVSVVDTDTNAVTHTITVGAEPAEVVVLPDGSRAYVANRMGNTVSVIDLASNTVIDTIHVGERPVAVAVSPGGKQVYVTNSEDGSVSVIETETNTVLTTVKVGAGPTGAVATPNGALLYVASQTSGTVSVIDLGDIGPSAPPQTV
ncbi:beta-propeller fold lactonase family protein [Mycolicibacterium sp. XJ1819]